MTLLMLTYPHDGRKLQRLIIAILKQGLATEITRVNYAKKYLLKAGKLTRSEQKIVLITPSEGRQEALIGFLKKQDPDNLISRIRVQTVESAAMT